MLCMQARYVHVHTHVQQPSNARPTPTLPRPSRASPQCTKARKTPPLSKKQKRQTQHPSSAPLTHPAKQNALQDCNALRLSALIGRAGPLPVAYPTPLYWSGLAWPGSRRSLALLSTLLPKRTLPPPVRIRLRPRVHPQKARAPTFGRGMKTSHPQDRQSRSTADPSDRP